MASAHSSSPQPTRYRLSPLVIARNEAIHAVVVQGHGLPRRRLLAMTEGGAPRNDGGGLLATAPPLSVFTLMQVQSKICMMT